MRIIPIASLLFMFALPALAETPSLEQQLDSMSARVTGTISTLHDTVLSLKNSNDQLASQVKTLTTERDDLKSQIEALNKKVGELNGNLNEERRLREEGKPSANTAPDRGGRPAH